MEVEFLLQPLDSLILMEDCTNQNCPINKKQCGCNTVEGCACPIKSIMEP